MQEVSLHLAPGDVQRRSPCECVCVGGGWQLCSSWLRVCIGMICPAWCSGKNTPGLPASQAVKTRGHQSCVERSAEAAPPLSLPTARVCLCVCVRAPYGDLYMCVCTYIYIWCSILDGGCKSCSVAPSFLCDGCADVTRLSCISPAEFPTADLYSPVTLGSWGETILSETILKNSWLFTASLKPLGICLLLYR